MSVSAIALTVLTFMIMSGCTALHPVKAMTASTAAVMAGTLTTDR